MSEQSGSVQTVLGLIEPVELGHTQPHEHLLCDLSPLLAWDLNSSDQTDELWDSRLRLDNYSRIRRYRRNVENARMTSEADAVDELKLYSRSGGGAIVDLTSIGLGRDHAALCRISQATGVHVIMGTGYYVHDVHPREVASESCHELAERMAREVLWGVGPEHTKAGIIGEIGLSWPVHPNEEKVLRAAAQVQVETGVPLQIHPGRDVRAPMEAIRTVLDAGGDPTRVVMSHLDRTLFDLSDFQELAETGCYMEFDLFGQESSYYPWSPIDMPNDATRVGILMELALRGHLKQLLVSQDVCYKVFLQKYGGEGYTHILESVIPLMLRKGLTRQDVEVLCVTNPATMLTIN